MHRLHIGLDVDNTIIDYDRVFGPVGTEIGLLPAGHRLHSKADVKALLVGKADGEADWMRLQGQVYGRFIERAVLHHGVAEFLHMARTAGARVSLVSHKTRHGHFDADRVDLWDAALTWFTARGFFTADGFGLDRGDVHFLETRDEKIARIAQIGCDVFVDDLPEVLQHEAFPPSVRRIWFTDSNENTDAFDAQGDWARITAIVAKLLADTAAEPLRQSGRSTAHMA